MKQFLHKPGRAWTKRDERQFRRQVKIVRLARLKSGISLACLSRHSTYPARYFSAVERGTHFPSPEFFNAWQRYLLLIASRKIEVSLARWKYDRKNPAIVPIPRREQKNLRVSRKRQV